MAGETTHPGRGSALPAPLRHDRIVALVDAGGGFVRTSDLAEALEISEVTVRQDLSTLDAAGRLRRVHGGAVESDAFAREERPFEETVVERAAAKEAIGRAAADLVRPGQCVALDVGTTAAAVARALVARTDLNDVTVVTNSLTNALALERAVPRLTVLVTGGTLRPLQHSLVAPFADTVLPVIAADLAFIGATGVSARSGVTNVNLPETEVKRALVAAARRTVVVADGEKLGRAHIGVVCGLGAVGAVVTAGAAEREVEALRVAGVEVRVADEGGGDRGWSGPGAGAGVAAGG